MKRAILLGIVVFTCSAGILYADTFGTGDDQFEINFVTISGSTNPSIGYGIVNNDYRIGTHEITNEQWDRFQASQEAISGNPSSAYDESPYWSGDNLPTNEVSWYEATQFVNWLNTSTDHQAAYKFTGTPGASDYTFTLWDAADPGYDASNPFRNSNAYYFLPTEDEWVKAAYWNGSALQTYATVDGAAPIAGIDSNFGDRTYPFDGPWAVGNGSKELNGTYDMMGNVGELSESTFSGNYTNHHAQDLRLVRWGLHYGQYRHPWCVVSIRHYAVPRER